MIATMIGKNNIHFSFYGIYSDQLALERERERDRDIRSPQSQVVSEKLHDQCTVLV